MDTMVFLLKELKSFKDNKDLVAISFNHRDEHIAGYVLEVNVLDHDQRHYFNLDAFGEQVETMEIIYVRFEQAENLIIISEKDYMKYVELPLVRIQNFLTRANRLRVVLSGGYLKYRKHVKETLEKLLRLADRLEEPLLDLRKTKDKRIVTFFVRDPTTISFTKMITIEESEQITFNQDKENLIKRYKKMKEEL